MRMQVKRWGQPALYMLVLSMVPIVAWADLACMPPPYALLRQDEDYSYLRDAACRRDFMDRVKFIPLNAREDQSLTLGGEVRERYEVFQNANWGVGPQDRNGYFLQRISTYADWHLGGGIRLFGQLASATEAGRNGGPRPIDEDRLWVEQAFAEFGVPIFSDTRATIRLGRQEFEFGAGRFVDVREGPNIRQAFDGVSAKLDGGPSNVTAFVTRPVLNRPPVFDDPADKSRTLWGVYATLPIPSIDGSLDLYYFGFKNRQAIFDRGSGDEKRHTFGVRAFGHAGSWDYDWELSYQTGSFAGLPLSAYAFGTSTGYTFKSVRFVPRVGLKMGAASGDGGQGSSVFKTFNPLFPTGIYFGRAPVGLNGPSNVSQLGVSFQAQLSDSVQFGIDYDSFWRNNLNDGVYGMGGDVLRTGQESRERFIGDQLSASIAWHAARHLDFSLLYAYFFAGPFLTRSATPGRNVQYAAATATFKF